MIKDKIQVGDLVQWRPPAWAPTKGIGLVVRVDRPVADWLDASKYVRYRVYWFELGALRIYYGSQIKLCPTQENE